MGVGYPAATPRRSVQLIEYWGQESHPTLKHELHDTPPNYEGNTFTWYQDQVRLICVHVWHICSHVHLILRKQQTGRTTCTVILPILRLHQNNQCCCSIVLIPDRVAVGRRFGTRGRACARCRWPSPPTAAWPPPRQAPPTRFTASGLTHGRLRNKVRLVLRPNDPAGLYSEGGEVILFRTQAL